MDLRYLALLVFLTCLLWDISSAGAAADQQPNGTFHAMGVIVTMNAGDDADADAEAAVTSRTGNEAFQSGFPGYTFRQ
jgi:hypothetical protein